MVLSLLEKAVSNFFLRRKFNKLSQETDDVKIHLGPESVIIDGYINIDIRQLPGVDLVADINDLSFIAANSICQIYSSHTLEHISHQKIYSVLQHWFRIIRPNGSLILSVPDFDKIISIYNQTGQQIEYIKSPLMGEQDHDYNMHYSVFNRSYLEEILLEIGFSSVKDLTRDEMITDQDWSFKKMTVESAGLEFAVSLNLIAKK